MLFDFIKRFWLVNPATGLFAPGGGSSARYQIANSVRLRAAASAYLSRTPASAESVLTKCCFSGWIKKCLLTDDTASRYGLPVISAGNAGAQYTTINLSDGGGNSNQINLYHDGYQRYRTNAVLRDTTAHYHLFVKLDSTASAGLRARFWLNGVELTTVVVNEISESDVFEFGNNILHTIGKSAVWGYYNDAVFSDFHLVCGTGTPNATDFGEFNTDGVWVPKRYTGTYGTNGFKLDFKDAAVTSGSNAGLGKDVSGNGNYWNTSNISVTSGVTYDSFTDTPTNNYATWNPLASPTNAPTEANMAVVNSTGTKKATIAFPLSGKYYWEQKPGTNSIIGICNADAPTSTSPFYNNTYAYGYYNNGTLYPAGTGGWGATYSSADVIAGEVDFDAATPTLKFFKNDVQQGSTLNLTAGVQYIIATGIGGAGVETINCGQRPFEYPTRSSGAVALCTANLPSVAIKKPASHFDVRSRAATGGTATVTGYAFAPALTWIKSRTFGNPHYLADYVRGANKFLGSDTTAAEDTGKTDELTAFTSDGYTLGASANGYTNLTPSARNYVDWNWKAGGAPSTDNVAGAGNTPTAGSVKIDGANLGSALAGTIAATRLSANTTAGFSIVTYTGNGSASATVAHGLGVTPNLVIVKTRNRTGENFRIHHSSVSLSNTLYFNTTAAQADGDRVSATSSTTFTLSSGGAPINSSPDTYVAYCFAEIPGYSKFGSYVGNGLTDGPFVYCGFRPKFLMIKCSSTTSHWALVDAARSLYNVTDAGLYADNSAAENTGAAFGAGYDFVSNGFKARLSVTNEENVSGQTYIFAAFAEHPFGGSNVAPSPAR